MGILTLVFPNEEMERKVIEFKKDFLLMVKKS